MQVTIYTRETAPHEPVLETARTSFGPEAWQEQHDADRTNVPYSAMCASCNWSDPAVRKARESKRRRLAAFQRTGKLAANWLPPPTLKRSKTMTDKEARRVVLPVIRLSPSAGSDSYLSDKDVTLENAAGAYLKAMRSRPAKKLKAEKTWESDRTEWSCGCVVTPRHKAVEHVAPCAKHRRAFEGREDERAPEVAA